MVPVRRLVLTLLSTVLVSCAGSSPGPQASPASSPVEPRPDVFEVETSYGSGGRCQVEGPPLVTLSVVGEDRAVDWDGDGRADGYRRGRTVYLPADDFGVDDAAVDFVSIDLDGEAVVIATASASWTGNEGAMLFESSLRPLVEAQQFEDRSMGSPQPVDDPGSVLTWTSGFEGIVESKLEMRPPDPRYANELLFRRVDDVIEVASDPDRRSMPFEQLPAATVLSSNVNLEPDCGRIGERSIQQARACIAQETQGLTIGEYAASSSWLIPPRCAG